ncbi:MAG: Lrp/AsnC family transcriptional regulator, partial [Planctomycetota bacterium]
MILCDTDRKILHRLQSNLPLVSRPFLELSKELGIDEDTIIERIKFMIEKGYVRRLAPIINTQAMGREA